MKNLFIAMMLFVSWQANANTIIRCEKNDKKVEVYIPMGADEKATFTVTQNELELGKGEFDQVQSGLDKFLNLWVIGATSKTAVVGVALLDSQMPVPGSHAAKGDLFISDKNSVLFDANTVDCLVIIPAIDPI